MTGRLLLTEPEAAERLRICPRMLRKARKDGRLHYVLIGRAVRYTVDDLESYIATLRQVQPACPQIKSAPKPKRQHRSGGGIVVPFSARNAAG